MANTALLHSAWNNKDSASAKAEIIAAAGNLDGVEVFGQQVLIGVYIRPAKTASGLIMLKDSQKEDIYQGKVGLVLKLGPDAFRDVDIDLFGGRLPEVGDWVFHAVEQGFQMSVCGPGSELTADRKGTNWAEKGGWPCRLVYGTDIYGRLDNPSVVA